MTAIKETIARATAEGREYLVLEVSTNGNRLR
jgi:hypothetical protein